MAGGARPGVALGMNTVALWSEEDRLKAVERNGARLTTVSMARSRALIEVGETIQAFLKKTKDLEPEAARKLSEAADKALKVAFVVPKGP
jgi:hypothetical protein